MAKTGGKKELSDIGDCFQCDRKDIMTMSVGQYTPEYGYESIYELCYKCGPTKKEQAEIKEQEAEDHAAFMKFVENNE